MTTNAYETAVLADSPLAYYRFDETSGTVLHDSSGHGRSATIHGTITLGATGLLPGDTDTAITLPGNASDYISLPVSGMPTGAMSVEFLLSSPTANPVGNLFDLGDEPSNHDFNLAVQGTSGWYIGNWNTGGDVGAPVAANGVYHVVAIYDGTAGTASLYVNGTLAGTRSGLNHPLTWNYANIGVSASGTPTGGGDGEFAGTLDEFAIYSGALSSTRITAHYQASIAYNGPTTPVAPSASYYATRVLNDFPLAYYRLDETSGTVLYDSSGHGRNGTISGAITLRAPGLLTGDTDTAITLPGSQPALTSDYISLPTTGMPNGAMAVECLIRSATANPVGVVCDLGLQSPADDLLIYCNGASGLYIGNFSGAGGADFGSALAADTTYHVIAVYNGSGTVTVYIDGAPVGSVSGVSAPVWDYCNIGAAANSVHGSTQAPVTLDEFAIYSGVLSAAQVEAHYQASVKADTGSYLVTVDGGIVNLEAGTLDMQNQIGQRSTGSMSIWGPLGVRYQYGTQVRVFSNVGMLAFTGFVSRDHAYKSGSPQYQGYLEHDLTLMDNCYKADKRVVFYSYLSTNAGAIARDLVDRVLAEEGVTYTDASIASGATIPEAIWNGKQVSAALQWLAQQSGYWWNIDTNSVFWFQPYGGIPAPWALDGTQTDWANLAVDSGNDMYVNTQYTRGGFTEKGSTANPLIETFHGNGTSRSFTLSYQVSRVLEVTLNGTDVTAQSLTKGSGGGYFYYAPSDAVIAQDPSQTVLGTSDTLVITYVGRLPSIGKATNAALVAAQKAREGGGSGKVESVYTDTKIHTLPAALSIASAMLAHYGQDTTILTFDTQHTGLMEGQMLSVDLPDWDLSGTQMLVTSVTMSDQRDSQNIWYTVQAVGSPYDQAQWQTYFANLMSQQADPSDLSDASDAVVTPIAISVFATSGPSFSVTTEVVESPICGVTSGTHTMVCGQWICS